ncbi:transducin, putative [Trichomonas vaginalis G3]|uniref:Transducin, putative n=1 Tax=Trichomonas vaginalis (strain ATCC PRA-98 / G3) TaxID=412133 RepID=A2EZR5_TRIV3|nr:WD40 repeat protein family [Trichomonas vaginalis G3]EAY01837.1 transducin, putative [Trichomonas vaginalis G3]KAI5497563.1 WD40 repeat protein family [Trichomonas vaginalis G3]|eukprot:XP_001314384.1 transducin [Trichomonas vaginalis G3]
MSVTADEINYLVHRYLEESGCPHSAFIFGSECRLDQANIQATQLPPQALITILKKGMLYMQMEKGINEKAKTDSSPESIVLSITEAVRREEPIIPTKPPVKLKDAPKPAVKIPDPIQIPQSSVLILDGHIGDVYCGAWTHDGKLLATGSSDATTIIWKIRDREYYQHYILDHAQQERSSKDIATLAWNPDSTLLATGCYDGTARLWTYKGELRFVLGHHVGPVFTVQFSPDGTNLLTGSSDKKIILWNANTGEMRQVFSHHKSYVLDLDWRDNSIFASCSGDSTVAVWKVGQQTPLHVFEGHKCEVNKITWDPTKKLLASCSDDKTIRIWRPFERANPIILQGHTHHVYTIKWCPGDPKILASGAFDFSVRLWDVTTQQCIRILTKHTQPIYTICFSPKGNYFVSGGIDNTLYVWRTSDQALVAYYEAKSGMFEAHWDPTGKYIAMCLANATVAVIDITDIINVNE